jgi:hypothetical protein
VDSTVHLGVLKHYKLYRQGTRETSVPTLVTNLGRGSATFVFGPLDARRMGFTSTIEPQRRAGSSFNHGDFSAADIVQACANRQFLLFHQLP